jgi:hypothetical protein
MRPPGTNQHDCAGGLLRQPNKYSPFSFSTKRSIAISGIFFTIAAKSDAGKKWDACSDVVLS